MSLSASVIVCTWNNARQLKEGLTSLPALSSVEGLDWDIIVVDNGSDDDTRAVVSDFAESTSIIVKYFFEKEIGLSKARNRGMLESDKDIVIYIDDDATAHPDWLQEILSVYQKGRTISAGGPIVPVIDPEVAERLDIKWLNDMGFDSHWGSSQKQVTRLCGSNMSFDRKALIELGGFDVRLGRKGKCILAGEDNAIFYAIRNQRGSSAITYNPKAIIYHKFNAAWLDEDRLKKRHYCGGISMAMIERKQKFRYLLPGLAVRCARFLFLSTKLIGRGLTFQKIRNSIPFIKIQVEIGYFKQLFFGSEIACRNCPYQPERIN